MGCSTVRQPARRPPIHTLDTAPMPATGAKLPRPALPRATMQGMQGMQGMKAMQNTVVMLAKPHRRPLRKQTRMPGTQCRARPPPKAPSTPATPCTR
jgi:hypothetical protein